MQREKGFRSEDPSGSEIRDFISTSESLGAKGVCAARKRHPRPIRNPVFCFPKQAAHFKILREILSSRFRLTLSFSGERQPPLLGLPETQLDEAEPGN